MENNKRKYYNRASLTGATRGEVGSGHKVLKLRFSTWDNDTKAQVSKFATLFLTEQNNERNRETLQFLGVEKPPEVVSYDTVEGVSGLGLRTVDLVAEDNEAGYENIKFINEPRFGEKVWDMK